VCDELPPRLLKEPFPFQLMHERRIDEAGWISTGCSVRFFMKLRDHRSMSYYGQRIWPPLWTRISGASAIPIIGEFGILINARMSTVDDNRCFLTMNYGATRYIACLWLDDKEFCRRLVDLLKKHHGEPIDQTAELEIPVKLLSSRSSESSLMAK